MKPPKTTDTFPQRERVSANEAWCLDTLFAGNAINTSNAVTPLDENGEYWSIGREPASGGIAIHDRTVSATHAALRRNPDGTFDLCDLGSRYGTAVEGAALRKHQWVQVDHNAMITLGRAIVMLRRCRPRPETADHMTLLGCSAELHDLVDHLAFAARSGLPAVLVGPTGSGKELAAETIHRLGCNCTGPFVAVNCAGIEKHLAESQLFGHTRGAFTDAKEARRGYFQAADGGTLFLDELEAFDCEVQAKILRAIEDQQITRLGDHHPVA